MRKMSFKKVPMPEQDPNIRNANFKEVTHGYTAEMAIVEANRCLQCKHKPCVTGCPVNVKIPEFIELIADGKFYEAALKIKETNNLPAICGRVCPQETQCEQQCVMGIKGESVAIGRLERFAADYYLQHLKENDIEIDKNGIKVAIIGGGPGGLACAADLAVLGYDVTIFEAFHVPGGVLMYGIPEFRLPKELVQKEIDIVKNLGVKIKTNMVIGRTYSIQDLQEEGYKSIFIASGAGLPKFLNIPGENLNGVYSANEFLTRINLMKAYKSEYDTPVYVGESAAVVGGGNVAMDAARSAKRLGAKNVYIIYRRSEKELPARLEEIHHAKEEGIEFKFLTSPTKINGDDEGWMTSLSCENMELGEPDESGRRRPQVVEGSEHELNVDTLIIAIGQGPNPLITKDTAELTTTSWGGIVANDETGATSVPGVFAGGDAVTGAATVILAMGAGKKAAKAMDDYIKGL